MAAFSSTALFSSTATPTHTLLRPRLVSLRCSFSSSSAAASFDLRSYWTALIADIDRQLSDAIPLAHPPIIHQAMRYSVLAPGAKRASPVMCIAACEVFGGTRAAAYPTACALEMVHAASLIHDDLPCMDDDPARRGSPSNHAVYGVDMAILAGDALFPLGFRHIVTRTPPSLVPPDRLIRVVAEIARTVGSTGMAAGQFLDLAGSGRSEAATAEDVVDKKFGELAECSAACGAILGGAGAEEVERLRKYGRAVGVLYEVVDDIRGGGEEQKKKGRVGYVGAYGRERAAAAVEELRRRAKAELVALAEVYGEERLLPLFSFVEYAADRGFEMAPATPAAAAGDVRLFNNH